MTCWYPVNTQRQAPVRIERAPRANAYTDRNTTHRTGFSVVNTRNDDTVWIRWTLGAMTYDDCLTPATQPNNSMAAIGTITGIKISDSASC
ncbi:hypothetical protein [Kitasatospora indigofera]|uniref:hypothetical protein n=1 Tax=Kitasatospora indigofera TaxID=67307 RepID=UPI003685E84B